MENEIPPTSTVKTKRGWKINKFVVGGILILIAGVILAIVSLEGNTQYYLTIDELKSSPGQWTGNVRISGVVRGNTIQFDPDGGGITFQVANVPADLKTIDQMGGIAAVLHQAATDPSAEVLTIHYQGAKPDLLKDEAQAIITGRIQPDGTFLADELLLKCPSRYQEAPLN